MATSDDRARVFEELFDAHYWPLRAYVMRRCSSAVVDDIVSETFLVAWRRLDLVGEDPLPWLFAVARRLVANHLRADRRRGALLARLEGFVGTGVAWEPPAAMNPQLAGAVGSLSAREREALLLVAWEGLDPRRAAQAVGCSPAAFRVRLHRARQRVATALDDPAPGPPHSPVAKEA
jgi:RNA polymerase sigma-70 factor (ECF subfamily)